MSQLSSSEYERVIEFYTTINSDYARFEENVLFALAQIFDLHMTAFTVFKLKADGEIYVSRINSKSIPAEVIDRYKAELYKVDPFLNNYSQLCARNPSMTFFTEDSLEQNEYQNSKYYGFLSRFNITHEAIIGINDPNGNMINIIVYKTAGIGDFTEHEKALFQYIGHVFNQSKANCAKHLKLQRELDALSDYADSYSDGFALLDSKERILHCNSQFVILSAQLSSALTKADAAKDIIALLPGSAPSFGSAASSHADTAGISITMQKRKAVLSGRPGELFVLTLKDKQAEKVTVDTSYLCVKFGLTRREAEVTQLAAAGSSNKDIADRLFIGVSTVKSHLSKAFAKLEVNSRSELLKLLQYET